MEKNIPKRRFKEFIGSGEWEEKKLGDVAERFDNLRIPIAESKRIVGITPYYGANGIVDYVDGYTHNGEFVLLAEDGANDLNNYPIYYVNGKVWVNNHAHVIQGINNILENVFLVYCLKTIDISSYLVGGSRAKLNADTMMKLNILIPSLEEQEKIGNFFEKLDRLIDLNRKKLEKLKNIKSAYLSEMFPKEGEVYPKRRFEGFTEPWEEKKLGDVANRFDNLRIPIAESKRIVGITPYYGANGIVDYVDGYTHNGEFVLLAEDGANDLNNYPIHYVNGKIWVNNHAHVIQGINDILENIFLVYCLKIIDISSYLVGGSRAKLNADTMMKLNISIPSPEEQEKIGNFFKKLDERIILQEEKIEKLENMKRAYLSEMFV